jgi:hypothetical protein
MAAATPSETATIPRVRSPGQRRVEADRSFT